LTHFTFWGIQFFSIFLTTGYLHVTKFIISLGR
jgi:hypothetical protein